MGIVSGTASGGDSQKLCLAPADAFRYRQYNPNAKAGSRTYALSA